MSNERKEIDLIYQRARANSVGYARPQPVRKNKKRVKQLAFKKFVVKSTITILLATTAFYATKKLCDDATVVSTEIGDMRNLVNESTKRTSDNKGFYYDTFNIALELIEHPEDFDNNLYGVYCEIGYNEANKISETNSVVATAHSLSIGKDYEIGYEDFDDYLIKKGYTKEDGTIDYNEYSKEMKEKIIEESKDNEQGKVM